MMKFIDLDNRWEQLVLALVVLVFAFIVSLIIKFSINRFVRIASSKLRVDPTKYKFLKNAVDFLVYLIATIIIFKSIPELDAFGNGLLASAGIIAAIVGFASQSAFSNIVSGIFLVIFRPFSVGDRIKVGQLYTGDVEDITLRHTVIRDFENKRIIFPNTVISSEVIINSTTSDEKVCMFVEVGISYSSPIDKAMEIMRSEGENHPYFIDNRSEDDIAANVPSVTVRVIQLADSSVQLRASVWAKDPSTGFAMKCDLLKSIKERFESEGIEIPFPHRVVIMKNQE
ncbi:mechanosensitive ion channel family protein [Chryseotalea sanaruensis]|uniref:Mechanosensitive ion channel family protein n=1 Tax=Chryseotalea sanaruensis TaxID=2482724 RepID=A0A401U922_9BACT|nr:mechanosensitive ion channel family protein [Chryseotalea sanaruensis]GCC51386.1 mechanosensitive ion channel family protein [Chryseotalea sanaruensis]